MRLSFSLPDLLPHRPPMILLDEIVDFDEQDASMTTAFTSREPWSGNWTAIEYMAQTAAALAGAFDRLKNSERPARAGFLLGTRRLTLNLARFLPGARYTVKAKCVLEDDNTAAFACEIRDSSDSVVATATLNAYRPDDITKFLPSKADNLVAPECRPTRTFAASATYRRAR